MTTPITSGGFYFYTVLTSPLPQDEPIVSDFLSSLPRLILQYAWKKTLGMQQSFIEEWWWHMLIFLSARVFHLCLSWARLLCNNQSIKSTKSTNHMRLQYNITYLLCELFVRVKYYYVFFALLPRIILEDTMWTACARWQIFQEEILFCRSPEYRASPVAIYKENKMTRNEKQNHTNTRAAFSPLPHQTTKASDKWVRPPPFHESWSVHLTADPTIT